MLRVLALPAFKNRLENPYNSLLYEPMAEMGVEVREFSPGRLLLSPTAVWHIHWPDGLLRYRQAARCALKATALLTLMDLARARGTRVVWTVHNLGSHEGLHPALERWYWRRFIARLDGYVSLSEAGRQAALEKYPLLRRLPGFVIRHGHYRDVYSNQISRADARRRLQLPAESPVLLHLGQIRPYKNVPFLLRTFRALDDPQAVLLVAGQVEAGSACAAELQTAAAHDARVRLSLGFIPHADVQCYLNAADLVVLPFAEVLNSGSALLALSFHRPLLAPQQGSMPELQQAVGAEWMQTYAGALTAETLGSALHWARTTPRSACAPLEAFEWPALSRQLVDAYTAICAPADPAFGR